MCGESEELGCMGIPLRAVWLKQNWGVNAGCGVLSCIDMVGGVEGGGIGDGTVVFQKRPARFAFEGVIW